MSNLTRKKYLASEDRIRELEEDMVRVIDMCIMLEHEVETQGRFLRKILHLMRDQLDE